jgi:hypothetical protein
VESPQGGTIRTLITGVFVAVVFWLIKPQMNLYINNSVHITPKLVAQTETVKQETPAKAQESESVPKSVQMAASVQPVVARGCATYLPIVSQYAWNVSVAIQVMQAESGCNPSTDNISDYHPTCYGSRGLFQIGCDSTSNFAGMFDPTANIAQAYALYVRRGWQPWSSTTCRYKVQCY